MAEYPKKVFIGGFSIKDAGIEKMPWVKSKLGIKVKDFIEFANEHMDDRGWLNILVNESQAGTLYMELDQFKPQKKEEYKPIPQTQKQIDEMKNRTDIEYPEEDINPDDIPF